MRSFYNKITSKLDIKAKVEKQGRLCISEISIVWYCFRKKEEKEGEQIRELGPVRAQSAGGNAFGNPPYPCSDLEDAPIAARSRRIGQRGCVEYQPASSFSESTLQQLKTIQLESVRA